MSDGPRNAGDAAGVTRAAQRLLTEGLVGDEALRRSGSVSQALPVLASRDVLHSWFVPVTVGDKLAAFLQLLPGGTLMRFSSFQHRPGDLAACPLAADWLDPHRIQARAETHRRRGETTGEPFLTFDRTPDRLVWAVPLTQPGGESRHVYVTGEAVYGPPTGDSIG